MFRFAKANERLDEIGRTRKWFAKTLNLSPNTIRQYLSGHQKPGRDTTIRMAELLELEPWDLDEDIPRSPIEATAS